MTTDRHRTRRSNLAPEGPHLSRLLPRIVTDVQNLLDLDRRAVLTEDADGSHEIRVVHPSGPEIGRIDAGVNHARKLDKS